MARRKIVVDPSFPSRLRELRVAAGMAYRDFKNVSHGYVHELEFGSKRPTPEMARTLDNQLGANGRLAALVTVGAPSAPLHQRAADIEDRVVMEPLADLVDRAATIDPETALAILDIAIADIVARYEAEGPSRLVAEAVHLRGHATRLRNGGQSTSRPMAQISALLAYMAVNLGQFAHADAYAVEAFAIAREVGDGDLMAWVRGTQSFAAYYRQRYRQALDYARDGLNHAGNGPQAVRLRINGEARALANMPGGRRDAERAVAEAHRLAERHDPATGISSCISFGIYSHGRIVANEITVFQKLGDHERVLGLVDEIALIINESDSAWSRSLVGLDHAAALLQKPSSDIDAAMAVATMAIEASCSTPITSVIQRGHILAAATQSWGRHAAVVELREKIRVLAAAHGPTSQNVLSSAK